MAVLVTGGTGYIGSHTVVELLKTNEDVVILDNLSNSKKMVLKRIAEITGKEPLFVEGDICDGDLLDRLFTEHSIDSVVHFAGLKAVGESTEIPLLYYKNNVVGTVTLCNAMSKAGVFRLVFSSSSTVYGSAETMPIREDFPRSATNPYGRSKLMIEDILIDLCKSDSRWSVALLRYFNPVGAHSSGKIGEDPNGIPNNLLPYITQVAIGRLQKLNVFGDDYPTRDGTGVRDYIHVVDLSVGHLKALKRLEKGNGILAYNLGTGRGYSVLELVRAFENVSGKSIPYEVVGRRSGDVAEVYADPTLASTELGWVAQMGIDEMMADSWRWQEHNPNGFE